MRFSGFVQILAIILILAVPLLAENGHEAMQTDTSNFSEVEHSGGSEAIDHGGSHQALPPIWLVAPFILLLLMIATGPVLYPHYWEHQYPKVAITLGSIVAVYYAFLMDHGVQSLLHTLEEYISFIALLTALFVASGGILIKFNTRGGPLVNAAILFGGAILSNFIGTTGASMLLIRPFMRLNSDRLRPFHVIFFIFMVSNIGGGLTPIGDPPLFLGFLKGVPFFWVISHVWHIWLFAVIMIIGVFMLFDMRVETEKQENQGGKALEISGSKNFIYLGIVILSVFMDPAVIKGFPSLQDIFHVPFGIREVIMFTVAFLSYKNGDKKAMRGNEFNFEPIKEVAYLFVGIFATMIPALQLIGAYAKVHAADFTVTRFYWFTGALSGVLDNAPTYLNFLAGELGKFGLDIGKVAEVQAFSEGIASPIAGDANSAVYLMAISVAAVFFGAMTYIGNAPNFMVKNIAEQAGVNVPSFIGYIVKYAIPILLPIYFVVWYIFFNL
ncbi:MAG: sodium:proton antiporter [Candidatus Marinimicrobia bacterium]|nr:sodium:proton antiporter [Candidatus Neomarinimicrobiota bacterium]MCF7851435.1 sodium:proton antiporter [Candidatus Neomarinimicrobiota bacterium]MCF7905295.1 sodium:proton antiporter [Candidatus Neomarinimicrobiota bacterium]